MASKYLKTLELLPDDVVLDIAGREIEPDVSSTCLAGWALRASVARAVPVQFAEEPDSWLSFTPPAKLAQRYGDYAGWQAIYYGIENPRKLPAIERAFMARLLQVVRRRDGSIKGGKNYAPRKLPAGVP